MRTIEVKLRDALRELGEQVPRGSTPPLRLPAGQADGNHAGMAARTDVASRTGGARIARKLRRRLAPLAAAAAVLAIAVGVSTMAALAHHKPPAKTRSGVLPGDVPPYYVAIHLMSGNPYPGLSRTRAVVTATRTGAELATVSVPRGYLSFVAVTAAADDRTFVLAAQKAYRPVKGALPTPPTTFFKLTIHPSAASPAQRVRLTALPVPAVARNVFFLDFALSPDGSKLAVSSAGWKTRANPAGFAEVRVSDLRTGDGRSWLFHGRSWTRVFWERDNRTVALVGSGDRDYRWRVLLVNTSAAGNASEHVALRLASRPQLIWRDEVVTPDGRTLIVARESPRPGGWPIVGVVRLQMYDIRTGHLIATIDARKVRLGESDYVLWSSPAGRMLVVTVPLQRFVTGPGIHTELRAGVFAGGRFTPIPWSRYARTAAF
jgi:hypothetical protein